MLTDAERGMLIAIEAGISYLIFSPTFRGHNPEEDHRRYVEIGEALRDARDGLLRDAARVPVRPVIPNCALCGARYESHDERQADGSRGVTTSRGYHAYSPTLDIKAPAQKKGTL